MRSRIALERIRLLSSVPSASRRNMQLISAFEQRCLAILLLVALTCGVGAPAQKPGLTLESNGNLLLIRKDGHRTALAEHGHCIEGSGAPKNEYFVCLVSRGISDQGFLPVFQIEIYESDGRKLILEPGGPIREWHLWNNYRQIAIAFDKTSNGVAHALYDARTGKLLHQFDDPVSPSLLPQWAKSRLQIDNESIPMDQLSQEIRSKWITKLLMQVQTIKPGMHRRDLVQFFRLDGGFNPIDHQYRFVLKECTTIKIDVSFKDFNGNIPLQKEDLDDVIETVSRPYLQFPIFD